ncbi:MAG: arylsulfatase [Planctomycetota bacterium]|jgi:arylsulfatase
MRAHSIIALYICFLLGCSDDGEGREISEDLGPPNILLIITDQQNRHTLGCLGERAVLTPALDKLADEGILFRSGYCNDPICSPSRYSLLSGVYPTEIGALMNHVAPRRDIPLISDYLSDAGYITSILGKADFVDMEDPHGFQNAYMHSAYLGSGTSHWYPWMLLSAEERGLEVKRKSLPTGPWTLGNLKRTCVTNPLPDDLTPEAWITLKSLDLMERAQLAGKPFFINANYFAPHHPYGPVQEYLDLYDKNEIQLPPNFNPEGGLPRGTQAGKFEKWSEDEWRLVLQHYYAFVSQADHHIGDLLEGMQERGLAENTLVFFVSDHGDMAGEFRSMAKGQPLEGSIGIPFIVRWPAGLPSGVTLDAPVSLIDIAPTIMEAAREPIPENFRGTSLLGLVKGEQAAEEREVFVIDVRKLPFHLSALRIGQWKLSALGGMNGKHRYRFIDLVADPFELVDRSRDETVHEEFAGMKAKLLSNLERELAFVPDTLPSPTSPPLVKFPYKD